MRGATVAIDYYLGSVLPAYKWLGKSFFTFRKVFVHVFQLSLVINCGGASKIIQSQPSVVLKFAISSFEFLYNCGIIFGRKYKLA